MSRRTVKHRLKLTDKNYYSRDNMYVTNSKIGDYLKDKSWFYRKHITGVLAPEKTDALVIGSAVDCVLTEGWTVFKKRYVAVAKRNKMDPPPGITELTQSQYDNVVMMCDRIMAQAAFSELAGFKAQQIFQYDMPLGIFYGIAGRLDWYKIEGDTAIIRDLKTSSTIDERSYYYHCLKYGYFRQMAMYQLLIEKTLNIKKFLSQHLTVEKDVDNVYNCQTFTLDQRIIDREKVFIYHILDEMARETEFKPNSVSFKDAPILSNPREVEVVGSDYKPSFITPEGFTRVLPSLNL